MFERFPAELERQPVLRVHPGRLARGDAEEAGVELVDAVEEGAPASTGWAGGRVPAGGGPLGDGGPAADEQAPEVVGAVGARQSAGQADDGDRAVAGRVTAWGTRHLAPPSAVAVSRNSLINRSQSCGHSSAGKCPHWSVAETAAGRQSLSSRDVAEGTRRSSAVAMTRVGMVTLARSARTSRQSTSSSCPALPGLTVWLTSSAKPCTCSSVMASR